MMDTLGFRIAQKRRQKGLTQEAMAEQLGVSAQAVSKWENDQSCPDISLLPALAKILGCTVDELLTGEANEVTLVPEGQRKPFDQLILRVYVDSADGDKVRVNLPMPIVKIGMEMGITVMNAEGRGMDALKNIDLSKLIELAEQGIIGKIVEVQSADGDTVEIVVE